MSKVPAQAWYKNGQFVVQTDTHRYVADVSIADLMNIKAGYAAAVELEIKELPKDEATTP